MTQPQKVWAGRLLALSLAVLALTPLSGRGEEPPSEKPFTVEYYYKVKWGHFDEFLELYKRNHYPILKRIQETGDIVEMRAAYPVYHAGEESRWDFRFTIVWRSAAVAHADADRTPILEELYPDKKKFQSEEQRRFELLLEHTDVPVEEQDLAEWRAPR